MFGNKVNIDNKLSCLILRLLLILIPEASSFVSSLPEVIDFKNAYLNVATTSDEPTIKIFNSELLEVGDELSVGCISKNGFPPAKIYWDLDTKPFEAAYQFEKTNEKNGLISVINIIKWNLTTDDNNRKLICTVRHPGYSKGFLTAEHKLEVNFKPIELPVKVYTEFKIGTPMNLSVSFQSNPKPSSLIWFVDNKKVYYGTESRKYVSKEMTTEANSTWNASLLIKNLTFEDVKMNYSVRVKNSVGVSVYEFYLQEKEIEAFTTQDDVDVTTIRNNFEDDKLSEYENVTQLQDEEYGTTELTSSVGENYDLWSPYGEIYNDKIKSKYKVSRVMIFKRPIYNGTKTISRSNQSSERGFYSNHVQLFLMKFTSFLLLLVIGLLIILLIYYRRRIIILKSKIVENNLGSSLGRLYSSTHSTNTYTSTYFKRNTALNVAKRINRPTHYDESTLNAPRIHVPTCSNLHSYVSIDALNNCPIYEEISSRKNSIVSSYNKENISEEDSISSHMSHNLTEFHLFQSKDYTKEMESTYI